MFRNQNFPSTSRPSRSVFTTVVSTINQPNQPRKRELDTTSSEHPQRRQRLDVKGNSQGILDGVPTGPRGDRKEEVPNGNLNGPRNSNVGKSIFERVGGIDNTRMGNGSINGNGLMNQGGMRPMMNGVQGPQGGLMGMNGPPMMNGNHSHQVPNGNMNQGYYPPQDVSPFFCSTRGQLLSLHL
jgi:hypothetical protein